MPCARGLERYLALRISLMRERVRLPCAKYRTSGLVLTCPAYLSYLPPSAPPLSHPVPLRPPLLHPPPPPLPPRVLPPLSLSLPTSSVSSRAAQLPFGLSSTHLALVSLLTSALALGLTRHSLLQVVVCSLSVRACCMLAVCACMLCVSERRACVCAYVCVLCATV